MRTITVHCFNDDGYSYDFEMQVSMDKDGNEIENLVEQEVSCNKFLIIIAQKSPHFNGEMDRAYLIFVRYKPDQKYIYQQFL